MKFYAIGLSVVALFALFSMSSCKKDEVSFDVSEGQTNWEKVKLVEFEWSDEYCGFGVNDLKFNPYNPQAAIVTGFFCYHESTGALYATNDGGQTWKHTNHMTTGMGSAFTSIYYRSNSKQFFTFSDVTETRVYRSSNQGLSLEIATTNQGYSWGTALRISTYNALQGLFKTNDGGDTWPYMETLNPLVTDFHAMYNPTIIASTKDGYGLISENYGDQWDTVYYSSEDQFYSAAVSLYGHYFLGGTKFIRSTDEGASWSDVSGIEGIVTDIIFIDSQMGFLCTSSSVPDQILGVNNASGKIYKTTDGGATWSLNYTSDFIAFNKLELSGDSALFAAGYQDNSNSKINAIYLVKTTTWGE